MGEDGTVLDGTIGKCGTGTVLRLLDTEESTGFVPASGTGTCDILESEGECQVPCPVDCSGGTWIDGQSCLRMNSDGSTSTLVDGGRPEDGTCGSGQITRTRNTDTDDFVAAIGRGSCLLETTAPCSRTCANGEVIGECGYSGIKVKDRDIGSTVFGHEGCVKKDGDDKPVKDENGKYVPVEVGETGVERWYEAAVYGDTAKCEDLVQWRTCQGPPPPIDCVGGWLDQDPNTAEIQEWSACKLPEGEVCGATYREKQYHITTPQGTRTVGGLTIPNGKACTATVRVDGQDEIRTMERGGQLTFTEWCGESQRVACCEKSDWVLDEDRGDRGCALDENGQNPTKRYTRRVTGACGPDDNPYDGDEDGNALEKFVACCFESGWSDVPDSCRRDGKSKEVQTVIGDACTNVQKSSANKVRYEKDCCYESGWSDVPNSCRSDGKSKEVQTVVGLGCSDDQMKTANKVRYEKDCCYQSGWSVVPNSCRSDGKEKEVQTVSGEMCSEHDLRFENRVRYEKDCCYKSGWFEPDGATCNSYGKKKEIQIVRGLECSPDELADTERYEKDCCYESGWSDVPNSCRSDGKSKEVQTVVGMGCDANQVKMSNKVRYEKDCCYEGDFEDVGSCNVQGRRKRERQVEGAECNEEDNPSVEWVDCCYEGNDWKDVGACENRGQKQKQTVVGTDEACAGVEDTRWVDCCEPGRWQNSGSCDKTTGVQKQTRTVTGTCIRNTEREINCAVDCEGEYESEPCPTACGLPASELTQTWKTSVTPLNGGQACPSLYATKTCEKTDPCPVDCVGEWIPKSKTETQCGELKCGADGGYLKGKQTKTDTWEEYKITTDAQHGGNACPNKTGDTRNEVSGEWSSLACNTNVEKCDDDNRPECKDKDPYCLYYSRDPYVNPCNARPDRYPGVREWMRDNCPRSCGTDPTCRIGNAGDCYESGGWFRGTCSSNGVEIQKQHVKNCSADKITREVPCGIDCVGAWEDKTSVSTECIDMTCGRGASHSYKRTTTAKWQQYKISQEAVGTGAKCPHKDGEETEKTYTYDPANIYIADVRTRLCMQPACK